MTMELVDPRGVAATAGSSLAPRRGSTSGQWHIGFLVNELNHTAGPDFTRYTEILEGQLRQRLTVDDVHRDHKPVLSRPAGDDMLAHYRDCSGVVSGLAK